MNTQFVIQTHLPHVHVWRSEVDVGVQSLQELGACHFSKAGLANELERASCFHLCSARNTGTCHQVHGLCYTGASLTEPSPKHHICLLTLYHSVFQFPSCMPQQQESSTIFLHFQVQYFVDKCILFYLSLTGHHFMFGPKYMIHTKFT